MFRSSPSEVLSWTGALKKARQNNDSSTGKGGGVALLTESDIKYNELGLNTKSNTYNNEYKTINRNVTKIKNLII